MLRAKLCDIKLFSDEIKSNCSRASSTLQQKWTSITNLCISGSKSFKVNCDYVFGQEHTVAGTARRKSLLSFISGDWTLINASRSCSEQWRITEDVSHTFNSQGYELITRPSFRTTFSPSNFDKLWQLKQEAQAEIDTLEIYFYRLI